MSEGDFRGKGWFETHADRIMLVCVLVVVALFVGLLWHAPDVTPALFSPTPPAVQAVPTPF